ncbi:MAG: hypothetical protein HY885_01380 [Deltaproteobacteria bacterium]|nr:hypothetical protein [Deltaproteobacteria bacterium]
MNEFLLKQWQLAVFQKHRPPVLLVHIRYLVAHNLNFGFCMDLNRHLLRKQGIEEADIRKIEEDPSQSLLEEGENAMLAFVVKAVKSPDVVSVIKVVPAPYLSHQYLNFLRPAPGFA